MVFYFSAAKKALVANFLTAKWPWWLTSAFRRVNKTFKNVWPIANSARVSDADDWIANIKT